MFFPSIYCYIAIQGGDNVDKKIGKITARIQHLANREAHEGAERKKRKPIQSQFQHCIYL